MIFDRRNDMEKFIAVAEAGTVLGAADDLQITQPALSRVIKRLEKRSRQPLFTRHRRGVMLTEFGVKALEIARRLLREHEAAESELMGISASPATRTREAQATLTPEEHVRLSEYLIQEAGRRSGQRALVEHREQLSAMPRHELGRLAALCRRADEDNAALMRVADIVRNAGPDPRA